MRKLFLFAAALVAVTLCHVSPAKADSFLGVVIAPKQHISTTFQHPSTDIGGSLRVLKLGPFNVSGVALYNDVAGIRYGGIVGLHLVSHTEIGVGATYEAGKFSKAFVGLTVRL
jgi:hypothetical protein